MKKDVVEVAIKGVMPTSNGCAVFLGDDSKTFVIHVDTALGNILTATLNGVHNERPLTHELIDYIFKGLGVDVERVVINAMDQGTFFARLIISMCNELGTKVIEIDARPSDCMVLALQAQKPIYVASKVYQEVDDMTEVLQKLIN
ncbi:MAG: hypothetical protein COZ46_02905 [Verrucomicrobia bacterium CG_4_10_14_3_um_filter_43_23]|nr:MAG: hypothetical protein AUJ82_00970 [Verrucomicrobia bacterium CG1_02_43_26]PIP59468.1 MAG: hypothetical protein COX01_02530 [Verrucomicrobia bacterium CG22_combo_CG10-13_8_21_14_all_43_17]PIX58629.1 MAG: hypothetical protein COZ46_02905 [Verrucomicrobia bacterium CG_4_10_14_3_um_filter_43_23]PIY61454.1 MAG: hypothetical protein COY94_05270 [Verrucomicrobia bacterium CG_4_10_14_0_8_um_filter_43_34]PJA43821.1 MAG: hypothetical protein CO175_06190 [Verrucomicrobia bacterium CG_4_9_14_3_um_fi